MVSEEVKTVVARLRRNDPTLFGLDLGGNSIGDEGAKALAEALKHNTTLTVLLLWKNSIGEEGAKALAEALKHNSTLTELHLRHNSTGEEGAKALAKALKRNTMLTELDLGSNSIGEEGAKALAEVLKQNATLTKLGLRDSSIGNVGAKAMAGALKQNTTLTGLYLAENYIGEEGAKALAEALKQNTTLTELALAENYIGEEGAKALAEALRQNATLTGLAIGSNSIGNEGATALAEALDFNSEITSIELRPSNIPDHLYGEIKQKLRGNMSSSRKEEVEQRKRERDQQHSQESMAFGLSKVEEAIVRLRRNDPALTAVDLQGSSIGDEGAKALAESLKQNTTLTRLDLTRLDLENNAIGKEGAKALAEALKQNAKLTQLYLGGNSIGDEGAKSLAEALKQNTMLTELILWENSIGKEGAKALAEALKDNATLTELYLQDNSIGEEGAKALAEALKQNATLTWLDVENNAIGNEGAKALGEALDFNSKITKIRLSSNNISDDLDVEISQKLDGNRSSSRKEEVEQRKKEREELKDQFETRVALQSEIDRLEHVIQEGKTSFDPEENSKAAQAKDTQRLLVNLRLDFLTDDELEKEINKLEQLMNQMSVGKDRQKISVEWKRLKDQLEKEKKARFALEGKIDENDPIVRGRKVVVDALESLDHMEFIQEVPLAYLASISNKWQDEIDSGGFGTVYKGIDMEANLKVAIKVLRSDSLSEQRKKEFETEIENLSKLSHPNIVRILGKSCSDQKLCMVLEYASGGSLHWILSSPTERSELSPSARLYIAQGLVAAVEHMHARKLLHRDIKPDNVCLNDGWQHTPKVTLIDFGIAKSVSNMQANSVMTSNPGTDCFKAPEYEAELIFDEKSEVYSIGAVFGCLLAGDCTFPLDYPDCKLEDVFESRDESGGIWLQDVARSFADVISECSSKDPTKRKTVKQLLDQIKDVRALNGKLDNLPIHTKKLIRTHRTSSRQSKLPENSSFATCVRCNSSRLLGILCPSKHMTCTVSTCLEELARNHNGRETIQCPGHGCSHSFLLCDLYSKITPELYGELLLASNRNKDYEFLKQWIDKRLSALSLQLSKGVGEVKDEMRKSNHEIVTLLTAVRQDQSEIASLSEKTIRTSIEQLKTHAARHDHEMQDLLEETDHLKKRQRGDPSDGIEQQLQELRTGIQKLTLQNAEGVRLLASGRLQCPRLLILWPGNGPRKRGLRRIIYKEYRLFFICPFDNSVVKTSITIKYVKSWFKKILPVLKLAVFSIRTIALVYGIPIPSLPDFIPGLNSQEKLDEVVAHMEKILVDVADEALSDIKEWANTCRDADELTEFLSRREREISAETYGALAIEAYKPKNLGWQNDMVIANAGDCFTWVKKENEQKWKERMKRIGQAQ